jgi:NAD(P)-dependent dehydrogenase (short-subunit alcohol dehydrogenase family)
MNLDLGGKNVLVTGGSKGIGFACARAFLAEGARVAIVSRAQVNIDHACGQLPKVLGLAADLTDADQAAQVVQQVTRAFGSIDILVNSAGAAKRTPADELSPAAYRAAMDAKYFSYINVIDPSVKEMAARGAGVIVNIIGNGGKIASPIHIAGGAANAALMLVTAGLANAYAAKGVRVVGLNPALTNTERVTEGLRADARHSGISEAEARQKSVARIPLGRMAEPEDVADATLFLASHRAGYITGVTITMDGAQIPVVV